MQINKKKIYLWTILSVILIAIIVFLLVFGISFIKKNNIYKQAIDADNKKDYINAYYLYEDIKDFKDSKDKMNNDIEQSYLLAKDLSTQGQYEDSIKYFNFVKKFKNIEEDLKETKYYYTIQLIDNGDIAKAKNFFEEIKGFKDTLESQKFYCLRLIGRKFHFYEVEYEYEGYTVKMGTLGVDFKFNDINTLTYSFHVHTDNSSIFSSNLYGDLLEEECSPSCSETNYNYKITDNKILIDINGEYQEVITIDSLAESKAVISGQMPESMSFINTEFDIY